MLSLATKPRGLSALPAAGGRACWRPSANRLVLTHGPAAVAPRAGAQAGIAAIGRHPAAQRAGIKAMAATVDGKHVEAATLALG
jgi:hypothetical protein